MKKPKILSVTSAEVFFPMGSEKPKPPSSDALLEWDTLNVTQLLKGLNQDITYVYVYGKLFQGQHYYSVRVILVILTRTSSNILQNPSQVARRKQTESSTINFNLILKVIISFSFSGRGHHDRRNKRHLRTRRSPCHFGEIFERKNRFTGKSNSYLRIALGSPSFSSFRLTLIF